MTGSAIRLTPFDERHISDTYLGWLNDRRLMRYSRQRLFTHTHETSRAYLESFRNTPNMFWAIERCADGLHVGSLTAYVDEHNRTADLGILVGHPAVAGTGCGREAWGLGLAFGFDVRNLRKMTGGTASRNAAMVRVFEAWRMTREGCQRQQELLDQGETTDVLLYGLLRDEWEAMAR